MDLLDYNDYELVSLAQDGSSEAIEILYKKYNKIIVKKSSMAFINMKNCGIEINDIIQEAFFGFDEAIKNFSQDDNASFYTFALLCIDRKLANYSKLVVRKKYQVLNEAVTIDDKLENIIKGNIDIEDIVINGDSSKSIINKLYKKLTDNEKQVFNLKAKGYDFVEIANTLNKDIKYVYNAFNRIKIKFKKICNYDN